MKQGDIVKLKTINGKRQASKGVYSGENYWLLIGETGVIEQSPLQKTLYADFSKQPRVLVRFEKDLNKIGLIAHNDIKNTLWILVSDLEVIESK